VIGTIIIIIIIIIIIMKLKIRGQGPKGTVEPVKNIIIIALQPFVGPWPLFQFLDLTQSR
jgi:hypothetical protein